MSKDHVWCCDEFNKCVQEESIVKRNIRTWQIWIACGSEFCYSKRKARYKWSYWRIISYCPFCGKELV